MEEDNTVKMGRPTKYQGQTTIDLVEEYITSCVDEHNEFHKTRGSTSDSFERTLRVKLPTIVGLSLFLGVNKTSLYEWAKDDVNFSNALNKVLSLQEQRLLENGISGDYNSTIAKLILSSNHGYREKSDLTTDGKSININFDNSFNE